MVDVLQSYALGRWESPRDKGVVVADASTGDPVARVSSSGIDGGRMATYARRVGGGAVGGIGCE